MHRQAGKSHPVVSNIALQMTFVSPDETRARISSRSASGVLHEMCSAAIPHFTNSFAMLCECRMFVAKQTVGRPFASLSQCVTMSPTMFGLFIASPSCFSL